MESKFTDQELFELHKDMEELHVYLESLEMVKHKALFLIKKINDRLTPPPNNDKIS